MTVNNPQKTKGGQKYWAAVDADTRELLRQVLLELKKFNLYLTLITGEQVARDGDIE